MRKILNLKVFLPALWAMGLLAFALQRMLYAPAPDATGLLAAEDPRKLAGLLLTAAAMALAALAGRTARPAADHPIPGGLLPFAGYTAAAAGILITVLTQASLLGGRIGTLWSILGYASPVCLFLAGFARFQGKPVFFALHGLPCVFLALDLVDHYQLWCSNPQLQDYLYALLGTASLAFFAYQLAAFDVSKGRWQPLCFWGLLAQYLCLGELAQARNPWLYAGGLVWTACLLFPLAFVPRKGDSP